MRLAWPVWRVWRVWRVRLESLALSLSLSLSPSLTLTLGAPWRPWELWEPLESSQRPRVDRTGLGSNSCAPVPQSGGLSTDICAVLQCHEGEVS